MFDSIMGGLNQGLVWGFLALGVFITFRVLDFADLTVEGSFTTGGATAAAMIYAGINPWLATLCAVLTGGLAGLITALLNTKLKIPPILSGILTMIGLYSINIAIMGNRANLSLLNKSTVVSQLTGAMGIPTTYSTLIFVLVLAAVVIGAGYWYFGTESGASVRATGINEKMCRAQGIHTDNAKIIGLVLSNAFVGLAGALIAQMQGYADVNMGVGAIVIGLASVIIGETIFGKRRSFLLNLIAAVVGSVVYRIIVTLCIYFNILPSSYLKLLTAIIVAIALSIPSVRKLYRKFRSYRIATSPKYAARVKLGDERRAAAKMRAEAKKAETARQRDVRQEARLSEKAQRRAAWEQANPEAVARQKERADLRDRKRSEKSEARRVRREKANAAAEQRAAVQKANALRRAKTRLTQLETGLRAAEDSVSRFAQESTEYHKAIVLRDSYTARIDKQRDTVAMLDRTGETSEINLKVTGLTKIFNRNTVNEKIALRDVSVDIKKGDFITVIGGNGAGKSTLLNMISGVFAADAGRIFLDGIDVTSMPEYRRAAYLGRVFQDPMMGTAANMEIAENLALAARRGKRKTLHWAVTKEEREEFGQQLASLGLGLETRLMSKVGLLSGGQRQALTLLMATLVEPKLLLLDEHTAALDPKTAKIVLDLTEKITSSRGLTTLMITHNMNDALRLGNRLIMMHEGRIIYDVAGEEKKKLTVDDLLKKFETVAGEKLADEKMLLSE